MDAGKKAVASIVIVLAVVSVSLYAYSIFASQPVSSVWVTLGYDFSPIPPTLTMLIENKALKTVDWFDIKVNGSTVYTSQGLSISKGETYQSLPNDLHLPDNEYLAWTVTIGFTDGMALTHTRMWAPANVSGLYNHTDGTGIQGMWSNFNFDIPSNYEDNKYPHQLG